MSDILDEAISVKNFLASLGLAKPEKAPKEQAPSSLRQKSESVLTSILKEAGLKYHKKGQKKREDGHSFQYVIKDGEKEYLAKCFVIFATGHFTMSLWSADGQDLLQVIGIGYIPRQAKAMEVVGTQRLKAFFSENS